MTDGVLSPEEMRFLLRECATVVRPGETLVIRVPLDWAPAEVSKYQEHASSLAAAEGTGFRVFVISGEQVLAAMSDSDSAFAARVRSVISRDRERPAPSRAASPFPPGVRGNG